MASYASSFSDCGLRPKFVDPMRLGVADYKYPMSFDENVTSQLTPPSSVVNAVECTSVTNPNEDVPRTKAKETTVVASGKKTTFSAAKENETTPSTKESACRLLANWSKNSTGYQNVILTCFIPERVNDRRQANYGERYSNTLKKYTSLCALLHTTVVNSDSSWAESTRSFTRTT